MPHSMHYAWKLDRGKSLLARWKEILKNYSTFIVKISYLTEQWHNFRDIFDYLLMFAGFVVSKFLHAAINTLSSVYFIDGEVLEKYRSRLRELLVGVSQRLEMAVESRTYNILKSLPSLRKILSYFVRPSDMDMYIVKI